MQRLVLSLLVFISTVTFTAVAQQTDTTRILTGTLTGYVTDTKGKPVIGATIRIVGTIQGGISKAPDGQFTITGIRAGDYTVRVTNIGYPPTGRRVRISENAETHITIRLGEGDVPFGKVIVISCPPTNISERFGSTSIITAEDLDRLP